MANIDLFDEFTATTLAQLYEAFPRKVSIDARKISGHLDTNDFGTVVDEHGNPSMRYEIAKATVEWLAETGYIRCSAFGQYRIENAVLTPQGLAVLKAEPSSLKAGETTGEKLVRFVREGSIDLAKDAAKAAIASGIGVLIK